VNLFKGKMKYLSIVFKYKENQGVSLRAVPNVIALRLTAVSEGDFESISTWSMTTSAMVSFPIHRDRNQY
jgi:hypothetical protein